MNYKKEAERKARAMATELSDARKSRLLRSKDIIEPVEWGESRPRIASIGENNCKSSEREDSLPMLMHSSEFTSSLQETEKA